MTEADLYKPYPHTGELGKALHHFKSMAVMGDFDGLPLYLKEFGEQLFADILALEVELLMLKKTPRKKRKKAV